MLLSTFMVKLVIAAVICTAIKLLSELCPFSPVTLSHSAALTLPDHSSHYDRLSPRLPSNCFPVADPACLDFSASPQPRETTQPSVPDQEILPLLPLVSV